MLSRCRKNIKYYEKIEVCERWQKFENFLADMGEKPEGLSLDRIDGTKGYSPVNCRWAKASHQSHNIRSNIGSSSIYKGVTWIAKTSRWRARISKGYTQTHLGYFDSEDEAARAYNIAARLAFGDFARLNVIDPRS